MKKSILFALIMLLTAIGAQAQNITVRGTVLSKTDDEPLIGASVLSEANKNAAATDIDGKFTLSVPKGSKLTVSYVGYLPTTVLAEPEMTIYLAENSELLDEVVVIGYQTIRKADLTSAVAVMNLKESISENSGNIMNSLAGKMPGVNVVPDAAPGRSRLDPRARYVDSQLEQRPSIYYRRCAHRQHQHDQPGRHREHAGA